MWVNKAVINWMTPFQRPLINPAQKPHGFLWWQQPTVACVRYTNIQQRSSILREQFTLQSFIQHFQPCWFLVLPMDVPWDILSLRPLALCTLWRPQKTWMSFYLPRFKPQARADPTEIKAAQNSMISIQKCSERQSRYWASTEEMDMMLHSDVILYYISPVQLFHPAGGFRQQAVEPVWFLNRVFKWWVLEAVWDCVLCIRIWL